MRIRVDPRRVRVVEMADGTRYPVGRGGTVAIDRPDHAKAVERGLGQHDMAEAGFIRPRLGFMDTGRKDCACGFGAWPWAASCPRCGASLSEMPVTHASSSGGMIATDGETRHG